MKKRLPTLAVVGRYVLSPAIWELLELTEPGAGNEIQLTDAIAELMLRETVEAYCMKGRSHDCGSKLGYIQAFIEYSLRDDKHGEKIQDFIATLCSKQ